jgi:hypothetical protein
MPLISVGAPTLPLSLGSIHFVWQYDSENIFVGQRSSLQNKNMVTTFSIFSLQFDGSNKNVVAVF